ncbi:MAG: hypothetical protein IT439_05990 [Phycisphaerales bacterium]|nr:hypothetical protein [Phycisphaerales bacterium]
MVAMRDPDEVERRVQEVLRAQEGAEGFSIRVLSATPRPSSAHPEWWYVRVTYQQDPYNAYKYFQTMSRVEEVLEGQEIKVLLVPEIVAPPPDLT